MMINLGEATIPFDDIVAIEKVDNVHLVRKSYYNIQVYYPLDYKYFPNGFYVSYNTKGERDTYYNILATLLDSEIDSKIEKGE